MVCAQKFDLLLKYACFSTIWTSLKFTEGSEVYQTLAIVFRVFDYLDGDHNFMKVDYGLRTKIQLVTKICMFFDDMDVFEV